MPLITINQVQKYYGDNHVLKGVDLDIDMGQVISIIGRSGSGKSTLLRCINGLEGYQDGSIKLGGMTITDRDSRRAKSAARWGWCSRALTCSRT